MSLFFEVKCLDNYWMDCHKTLYRHECPSQDDLYY